jgi:hypothetical protein
MVTCSLLNFDPDSEIYKFLDNPMRGLNSTLCPNKTDLIFSGQSSGIVATPTKNTTALKAVYNSTLLKYNFVSQSFKMAKYLKEKEDPFSIRFR